jgi:hypothetical protein
MKPQADRAILEKSDVEAEAVETQWRWVAASVQGISHERTGQPCQDAHAIRLGAGSTLLAAVADGAGSAEHSEIGARLAADTAIDHLMNALKCAPEELPDDALTLMLRGAAEAAGVVVAEEAARTGIEARQLASTLIIVAASPNSAAALQIGDGAVVACSASGELTAITTPQNGEYLNETVFLTSAAAADNAQVAVWRQIPTHLAIFSDGLQPIAVSAKDNTPHGPFFEPLFRFARNAADKDMASQELDAFLRSPRISQRTDDDLTLVLASLIPAS